MRPERKKKQRYRHVDGKPWIEVRVKDPLQLFDVRDPAPFRDRDLDDDFVQYIISSAQEFPQSSPYQVIIYVDGKESKDLPREAIQEAIQSHFIYQIDLQSGELKRFVKRAQITFLIGILVLVSCLGVALSLPVPTGPSPSGILREGLVIFGWVSIWKPIELLLFDWFPIYEKLRLYRKMLATDFDVRFSS